MCKGNSIAILNCPFIVSIYVFAVRVRNLIGQRTESNRTADGIRSGGVRCRCGSRSVSDDISQAEQRHIAGRTTINNKQNNDIH